MQCKLKYTKAEASLLYEKIVHQSQTHENCQLDEKSLLLSKAGDIPGQISKIVVSRIENGSIGGAIWNGSEEPAFNGYLKN